MKRTLLEMVQSILSDMDSEAVNSISDSVEAEQVASVIQDTFFNLIAARDIPEHRQLIKLTALADSTKPTHFKYPTNTRQLSRVDYDIATTGTTYREITFVEPMVFIDRMNQDTPSSITVTDVAGGTTLFIGNSTSPSYYTSFDDEHIVMDSYDATVESTLQNSKSRAFGYVYPTFTISDSFEPDLDDTMLPYMLAEAKSTCFSLFKSGSDPKIEQSARRLKSFVQNDMYKTKRANKRPHYGRN
tara:strand:- start:6504 stop:7235 length:732 start_codon:yes stop_codon:yes gene_type:complete